MYPSPPCCPVTWCSPPPDRCHSAYWPPSSAGYSLRPRPLWTWSSSIHKSRKGIYYKSCTVGILISEVFIYWCLSPYIVEIKQWVISKLFTVILKINIEKLPFVSLKCLVELGIYVNFQIHRKLIWPILIIWSHNWILIFMLLSLHCRQKLPLTNPCIHVFCQQVYPVILVKYQFHPRYSYCSPVNLTKLKNLYIYDKVAMLF